MGRSGTYTERICVMIYLRFSSPLRQLLHSAHPPENLPSSNAPFLVAVWKEVLAARRPLAAISRPLSNKNSAKDGLKIDVVSAGGRLWTKVNT
jgi:hypothetical protein